MTDKKQLTHDEKLDSLVQDVSDIKIALKGYNGFKGLCDSHADLKKDYYLFKRNACIIAGIAIGSGLISTGLAVGLPEILNK